MMEILAWFTVIGLPVLLLGALAWFVVWRLQKKPIVSQPYTYTTTQNVPEVTSIAPEEEWDAEYPGEARGDEFTHEANLRVYRIYRSIDRKEWVECDPCLTERAACNYAAYIKANNPKEYVRCEDPDGMLLQYE